MNQSLSLPSGPSLVAARPRWQGVAVLTVLAALMVTAGCSTRRVTAPAPVVDRGFSRPADGAPAAAALPGAENAGKPGYYTVKPGDTLYRIALDNGQNWRDIAAWNSLSNPNTIEVGQVLRVQPPASSAPAVVASSQVRGSCWASCASMARPLCSACRYCGKLRAFIDGSCSWRSRSRRYSDTESR